MELEKKRLVWIDIAKGILIIFVVMGHLIPGPHWKLQSIFDYVYLFHMPAFFMLSGMLYKKNKNEASSVKSIAVKKAKRLLLPYLSYLLIITLCVIAYNLIVNSYNHGYYIKLILKQSLGGQYISYGGSLWFLTCLFVVEVTWSCIDSFFNKEYAKLLIVAFLYVLAHIQAWFFSSIRFPLAIDISAFAITYYYIGLRLRTIMFDKKIVLSSFCISAISLALIRSGVFKYGLELYGHHYVDVIFDLLIPTSLSITVFFLSKVLSDIQLTQPLQYLGRITLPIMAMQGMIMLIITEVLKFNFLLSLIATLLLTVLITKSVLNKSKRLSLYFGV